MINRLQGNILDVKEGFIVHGCNAQGVMGSGMAKQIKEKWPKVFDEYVDALWALRDPIGTYTKRKVDDKLFVVNMITQDQYGRDGKRYVNYAAIAVGFRALFDEINHKQSWTGMPVHFPLIGAGLGGGDWNIIEQIIQDADPHDEIMKNLWIL